MILLQSKQRLINKVEEFELLFIRIRKDEAKRIIDAVIQPIEKKLKHEPSGQDK